MSVVLLRKFPKLQLVVISIALTMLLGALFIFSNNKNFKDFKKMQSFHPKTQTCHAQHSFNDAMAAAVELNTIAREQRLSQDDPKILNFLWEYCNVFLQQPRSQVRSTGYRGIDPSMGQTAIALKLLNNMENGFYIEVGAYNGLDSSNSYLLEKRYGWNGILIDPDPSNIVEIFNSERNAWVSRACASIKNYPHQVTFKPEMNIGRIIRDPSRELNHSTLINAQCFPLYSFLAALRIDAVDFWTLDVEGFEFEVLSTFPFDMVLVKVVTVEIAHSRIAEISFIALMESRDFRLVSRIYNKKHNALFDLMFLHNSVQVDQSILDSVKEVHGDSIWIKAPGLNSEVDMKA